MRTWLRRIRGALGMGVVWAAAWGFAGGFPRWIFGIETDAPLPLIFGVFGFIAGVSFSAVIALIEGRRRFDQMSVPRFAAWGATGGLLLSVVLARATSLGWGDFVALASTLAIASAVCASGSLALARGAARQELPDGHDNAHDVEFIDREERNVLGGGS